MTSKLLAVNIGDFKPPTDAFSQGSSTSASAAAANFEEFISNTIGLLTVIAGVFFILYFVVGGISWVTAGGDQGKIQKARDQMIQGVIGMIVIALSYGLIGIFGSFFGLDILHPGNVVQTLNPLKTGP